MTGGGRGLGPALARGLALAGASVAVNYLSSRDGAETTVEAIRAMGEKAAAYQADISQGPAIASMVAAVNSDFGEVDILVNNAAIYPRTEWDHISEGEWDRVIGVNLKGSFLCIQAVTPSMKRRAYGRIVNLSSITAFLGRGPYAHYVASKAGLIGLTRALAVELGRYSITVNALAPGAILTPTEVDAFPDQQNLASWLDQQQALPGRLVPEDLVGAMVFLASEASAKITGQTLVVDGGWVKH